MLAPAAVLRKEKWALANGRCHLGGPLMWTPGHLHINVRLFHQKAVPDHKKTPESARQMQ